MIYEDVGDFKGRLLKTMEENFLKLPEVLFVMKQAYRGNSYKKYIVQAREKEAKGFK